MAELKIKSFSKRELNFLLLAARVAESSLCRQRVGAVVVKGGRVLGTATNADYNIPSNLEESKIAWHASVCAERRALSAIPGNVEGAVVFVARVARKDGSLAVSKPCWRCLRVMGERGIKRVVCLG